MSKTKPEPGQILFSLNVGNAARYKERTLKKVEVVKVGHKYFTCRPVDGGWCPETQYHNDGWAEKTDYAADSRLYESEQEWEEEKIACEVENDIRSVFTSYGRNKRLSLDQLKRIKEILDEGKDR